MTRHNKCVNPAGKNNTTGWAGTGTPVRATDFPAGCPRSTGVRASTGGYVQTAVGACAPGDVHTLSFYQHNGSAAFQFNRTAFVCYTRSSGGDVFPESWNTGSLGDIGSVLRTSFTTAAAPALATGIYILWDSLAVGLGMTGVLIEQVGALDTYADGDTSGWAWDGTDGNSASSELPPAPAQGSADLGIGLAVAAVGAAAARGVVALGLDLAVAAAGARDSAGAAALGLGMSAAAAGARASRGTAALGLSLGIGATGSDGSIERTRGPWLTSRPSSRRIVTRVQRAE